MNELMYSEIMDQPDAIALSLDDLRRQINQLSSLEIKPQRIILTGSGDAYFGAKSLEYAARKHLKDMDVAVLSSQEAARYFCYRETDILVVTSISGKTQRTVEAAQAGRDGGAFVLCITANEGSPLADISNLPVVIPFKSRSRITPHTTDHLTTLLAISIIIETLANKNFTFLNSLSGIVSETLQSTKDVCGQIANNFFDKNDFYFIGAGPSYGVAQYAAAKFWEARGIDAYYSELEELGHGLHMTLKNDDPLFIIAPSGKCAQKAANSLIGIKHLNIAPVVITDQPDLFDSNSIIVTPPVEEEWSPFYTSLPLQWICWHIANLKGYDVTTEGRHVTPDAYQSAMRLLRGD